MAHLLAETGSVPVAEIGLLYITAYSMTAEAMDDAVDKLGISILISSESILPRDLLPLYYPKRQIICIEIIQ